MKLGHKAERQRLDEGQRLRTIAEAKARSARFRKGVAGLWDRLTGRHGETVKRNDADALASIGRDRGQRDDLAARQLGERRTLQHDILSFETFPTIQRRLKGKAKLPARADINLDFPLRGFIVCAECGKPYQGCWSKGRSNSYPYLCATKNCAHYGKSIRRDDVEGQFGPQAARTRSRATRRSSHGNRKRHPDRGL